MFSNVKNKYKVIKSKNRYRFEENLCAQQKIEEKIQA